MAVVEACVAKSRWWRFFCWRARLLDGLLEDCLATASLAERCLLLLLRLDVVLVFWVLPEVLFESSFSMVVATVNLAVLGVLQLP